MPPKKKKLKLEKEDLEKGPSEPDLRTLWLHRYGSMETQLINFSSENKRLRVYERNVTECGHVHFSRCAGCGHVRCVQCKFGINTKNNMVPSTCKICDNFDDRITGEDIVTRSYDLMFQE